MSYDLEKTAFLGSVLRRSGKVPAVADKIKKVISTKPGISFGAELPYVAPKGQKAPGMLRSFAVGDPNAAAVTRARWDVGKVLGKGGLVRGPLAAPVRLTQAVDKIKGGDRSLSTFKDIALGTGEYGANVGFGLGFPVMTSYNIARDPNLSGDEKGKSIARELGMGLGYLAATPFGMLGGLAAGTLGGTGAEGLYNLLRPGASRPQATPSQLYYTY